MKTCFKCGVSKDLGAFYKHSQMADGHLNKCIDCTKRDARTHRIVNAESVRERDRLRGRRPSRALDRAQRNERWGAAHPQKKAAHVAVNNAVRDGRLARLPCAFCGARDNLEAHHHDYAKPLDVTWLCRPCHRRFHALESMATYREDAA